MSVAAKKTSVLAMEGQAGGDLAKRSAYEAPACPSMAGEEAPMQQGWYE
jgi:hypothetical protein